MKVYGLIDLEWCTDTSKIIEIGLTKLYHDVQTLTFDTPKSILIQRNKVSKRTQEITGLTVNTLARGIPSAKAKEVMLDFLESIDILVAWGDSDIHMLESFVGSTALELRKQKRFLDLQKKLAKQAKQETVRTWLDIYIKGNPHIAVYDVEVLAHIMLKYLKNPDEVQAVLQMENSFLNLNREVSRLINQYGVDTVKNYLATSLG